MKSFISVDFDRFLVPGETADEAELLLDKVCAILEREYGITTRVEKIFDYTTLAELKGQRHDSSC